jgi:hypothetical protein
LSSAIGLALLEKGWRVLFARTSDLVQRLQVARRELALEAALTRLDHFDVLILDDLAYVTKDQAETSALFELISTRYERRSMIITANQPFGEWGKVFQDPAMTLAAVDRLVHHSTIFEMNVESYRRRTAIERKQIGPGRPASYATPKNVGVPKAGDNQPPCLANDGVPRVRLSSGTSNTQTPCSITACSLLSPHPLPLVSTTYIIAVVYVLKPN